MIVPRIEDRRPLLATLALLIATAWLALVVWGQSPYGRFLSHDALEDVGSARVKYLGVAALFVAAWLLMTVAMMLPTAVPLVMLFRRFVAGRPGAGILTPLVIMGYLLTWTLVGAIAYLADLGVHVIVERSHWLEERSWVITAATLLGAGSYQFTPLKYHCLDKCRSPFAFIAERWHGRRRRLDALRLGIDHGVFCVGCCWPLMAVMFAVGMGNVAWMLGLGVLMAIEKNLPWGRRLTAPLGVVLLATGFALVLLNVDLTAACAHNGKTC